MGIFRRFYLFLFSKILLKFLTQKKEEKEDFAVARLATISATRLTGNTPFFKGWPGAGVGRGHLPGRGEDGPIEPAEGGGGHEQRHDP